MSGLNHTLAKGADLNRSREFESHRLRHFLNFFVHLGHGNYSSSGEFFSFCRSKI